MGREIRSRSRASAALIADWLSPMRRPAPTDAALGKECVEHDQQIQVDVSQIQRLASPDIRRHR